jgi:hypothetical protein
MRVFLNVLAGHAVEEATPVFSTADPVVVEAALNAVLQRLGLPASTDAGRAARVLRLHQRDAEPAS